MTTSEMFGGLLNNLKVGDKSAQIAARRDTITKVLNKEFRSTEGCTDHKLMVGSYGRHTAVRRVSDLDMIYQLPSDLRLSYATAGGSRRLLTRVRDTLQSRFPKSDIKVDQCVVRVEFRSDQFKFEVQPAFENEDGSFDFPDTSLDGLKTTRPKEEIEATKRLNDRTGNTMRDLARMARAWKNVHGVAMGGLLIDTLVYRFLSDDDERGKSTRRSYDALVRDFFGFLASEPNQEYYLALGSNQQVEVKERFQPKAKKAYEICLEAIADETEESARRKWREIFGRVMALRSAEAMRAPNDTEEFIEEKFPVDIRYALEIDCLVTQDGWRTTQLRKLLRSDRLLPRRDLEFSIARCNVPTPNEVKWKVRNRGTEAVRRNQVRGQIIPPNKGTALCEHSRFRGDHFVECYVVKEGIVVARDRIEVPISAGVRLGT